MEDQTIAWNESVDNVLTKVWQQGIEAVSRNQIFLVSTNTIPPFRNVNLATSIFCD